MKQNVIREKTFQLAVGVTRCCRELIVRKEYILSKQLLRSGTGIGANVREALNASSRRDFIYRLTVALRECDETIYWLELLRASDLLTEEKFLSLKDQAHEASRILTSIIKTSRQPLTKDTGPDMRV